MSALGGSGSGAGSAVVAVAAPPHLALQAPAAAPPAQVVLLIKGLPGSGKSTLARCAIRLVLLAPRPHARTL